MAKRKWDEPNKHWKDINFSMNNKGWDEPKQKLNIDRNIMKYVNNNSNTLQVSNRQNVFQSSNRSKTNNDFDISPKQMGQALYFTLIICIFFAICYGIYRGIIWINESPIHLFLVLLGGIIIVVLFIKYKKVREISKKLIISFYYGFSNNKNINNKNNNDLPKTKPLTQAEKDKLIIYVNNHCELCNESDPLDVHHIKPRHEYGNNEWPNLVVLCPNCHRKADRGAIPRSRLFLIAKNR